MHDALKRGGPIVAWPNSIKAWILMLKVPIYSHVQMYNDAPKDFAYVRGVELLAYTIVRYVGLYYYLRSP